MPGNDPKGVAVSDLSSWDSTVEEIHQPIPSGNNGHSYDLGMKHSEGMMDLSKVLSPVFSKEATMTSNAGKEIIYSGSHGGGDRIYDSVDNVTSENRQFDGHLKTSQTSNGYHHPKMQNGTMNVYAFNTKCGHLNSCKVLLFYSRNLSYNFPLYRNNTPRQWCHQWLKTKWF